MRNRTSGTEPKIKYYLEASSSSKSSDAVATVDTLLIKVVEELGDVWLEAGRWGLGRPKS
jgi:hypothetical protein